MELYEILPGSKVLRTYFKYLCYNLPQIYRACEIFWNGFSGDILHLPNSNTVNTLINCQVLKHFKVASHLGKVPDKVSSSWIHMVVLRSFASQLTAILCNFQTSIDVLLTYMPQSTSLRVLLHFGQIMKNGKY